MFTLFYFIILLTFCSSILPKLIPYVIRKYIGGPSKDYTTQKEKIALMLAELSQIPMTDEWAKYAKLQRKINKEKDDLARQSGEGGERLSKAVITVNLVVRVALGLTLALTVMMNRNTVVAELPETWLWPFETLVCWSRDVPGGITAPCWVIISSSVARSTAKLY